MFQEEKKKTKYGALCLACFFSCIFAFQFLKFGTKSSDSPISVINSPLSSGELSDRREFKRKQEPSTYCLKIADFVKYANSPNNLRYESRPFASGGYNWTLIVYPKGNKNEDGEGQLSLYVEIDNSTLVNNPRTIWAEVKFFIYNQKEAVYLTYQETDAKSFTLFKPFWGQPRTKSYNEIAKLESGYLFDGQLSIGVDIFVTEHFKQWEAFRFTALFHHHRFTWQISKFTSLEKELYITDKFEIGGRNWTLKMYPNGDGDGQGNSMSLYLVAADVKPNDRTYLRAKLRIINQKGLKNFEKPVESWTDRTNSWGFQKFVSIADLKNSSSGLLVNDTLKVEVEIEDLSKTRYFPE